MGLKRIFDFFCALLGLLLLSPLLLLISALIKLKMPGPILFRQSRVGLYGNNFILIKFRTMVVKHGGTSISIKGESRITPLGAFLRKYKLDELPELWNVLRGEMSLVGPRPDVPGYADKLLGADRKILELRPGITGPASLKYANEEELLSAQSDPVRYADEIIYPDKVRINLKYAEEQSFLLDLKIIFCTIFSRELPPEWE